MFDIVCSIKIEWYKCIISFLEGVGSMDVSKLVCNFGDIFVHVEEVLVIPISRVSLGKYDRL